MKRKIVIDQETGIIENIIIADDNYSVEGKLLIEHDRADFSWSYENGELIEPVPEEKPIQPYEPSSLEIRLDALEKKAGITQADKDSSRQALIDAKT